MEKQAEQQPWENEKLSIGEWYINTLAALYTDRKPTKHDRTMTPTGDKERLTTPLFCWQISADRSTWCYDCRFWADAAITLAQCLDTRETTETTHGGLVISPHHYGKVCNERDDFAERARRLHAENDKLASEVSALRGVELQMEGALNLAHGKLEMQEQRLKSLGEAAQELDARRRSLCMKHLDTYKTDTDCPHCERDAVALQAALKQQGHEERRAKVVALEAEIGRLYGLLETALDPRR